jgi:hypothetical protein
MGRIYTKGTIQLGVEIPLDLNERLRERCAKIGARVTDEVRLAIRRHLDHPPPDISPMLIDAAVPSRPAKTKRKKGETS